MNRNKQKLLLLAVLILALLGFTACENSPQTAKTPFPGYQSVIYTNYITDEIGLEYDDHVLTDQKEVKALWDLMRQADWEKKETFSGESDQDMILKFDGDKDVYHIFENGEVVHNETAFFQAPKEVKAALANYLIPKIEQFAEQERESRVLPDEIDTLFASVADLRMQTDEYFIYFEGRDERMADYRAALCVDTWSRDQIAEGEAKQSILLAAVAEQYRLTVWDNNRISFSIRGHEISYYTDEPVYENLQAVLKDETGKRMRDS